MPRNVKCPVCSRAFAISDEAYKDHLSGKRVSVRCEHCNKPFTLHSNTRKGSSSPAQAKTPKPEAPQLPKDSPADPKPRLPASIIAKPTFADAKATAPAQVAKAAFTDPKTLAPAPAAKPVSADAKAQAPTPAAKPPAADAKAKAAAPGAKPASADAKAQAPAPVAKPSVADKANASAPVAKPTLADASPQRPAPVAKPAQPRRTASQPKQAQVKPILTSTTGTDQQLPEVKKAPIRQSRMAIPRPRSIEPPAATIPSPARIDAPLPALPVKAMPILDVKGPAIIVDLPALAGAPSPPPEVATIDALLNEEPLPASVEPCPLPEVPTAELSLNVELPPLPVDTSPLPNASVSDSSLHEDFNAPLPGPPLLPELNHSEPELTPPGMALSPPADVQAQEQPAAAAIPLGTTSGKRRGRRVLLASAAAVLALAAVITFRLRPHPAPHQAAAHVPPEPVAQPAPQAASRAAATSVIHEPSAASAPAEATTANTQSAPAPVASTPAEVTTANTQPAPAASASSDDGIPDYVSKPTLIAVSAVAMRHAQHCHPHGHAVGTASVFLTFAPNGTVSEAHLEGEPVASAPVAACILYHAYAIKIGKFDGAPFTYTTSITMR